LLGVADNSNAVNDTHTTSEFDLGDLEWAKYIKVIDTSNPDDFTPPNSQVDYPTADGYDLNAIEALVCENVSDTIIETVTDENGYYCFFPEAGDYRVEERIGGEWEYGDWTYSEYYYQDGNFDGVNPWLVNFWNIPPGNNGNGDPIYGCMDRNATNYNPNATMQGEEACDYGGGSGGSGNTNQPNTGTIITTSMTFTETEEEPEILEEEPIVLGEEGAPILEISKAVDIAMTNPGDTLVYTITVKNSGLLDAFDVMVKDTLPAGFTDFDTKQTSYVWELGNLTANETKTIVYKVLVGENVLAGVYENKAVASADNHDEVSASADVEVELVAVLAESGNSIVEMFMLMLISVSSLFGASRARESLSL
jgi:uncharacterized repeat protein (TIGR01451 family)